MSIDPLAPVQSLPDDGPTHVWVANALVPDAFDEMLCCISALIFAPPYDPLRLAATDDCSLELLVSSRTTAS
jgi:hypothetical protein